MTQPQSISTSANASNSALYARLLTYVRPYWKALALAVVGMIVVALTEPLFPALMKTLLDKGMDTAENPRLVWAAPLAIVLLFVVRGVFTFCSNYLMTWISTHLITDLRREMFSKILELPTQTYSEQSSGKFISRLLYDVNSVSDAATTALIILVRESLTAIALVAYLLYLDWQLTLITLAVGPVMAIVVKLFGKRMRAASRKSLESIRLVSHAIEETVASHKVIKIYQGQGQQIERFRRDTERFRRSLMREAVPASATTPVTHITAALAIALITYLALSHTTGHAGASAGGFVSFITAMLLLIAPIKQLTSVSPILQRGLAGCESVFGLLDTPGEEDKGDIDLGHAKGMIEFLNVSFKYPSSEKFALLDMSLQIQAGQTVALVGASGGGKSTVGALIPRFYHCTTGTIRIDGQDIQDIRLTSLRKNIALVSQDIVLFNDSIEANIAFGVRDKVSSAEIERAARAANAWEFIEQLPNGLSTYVGENGAMLSGGQRQRIAIARALLRNAPILILDEATSALDTESERQVQAALVELMKNRTTLVIAHRLSTVERADKIVVLDQGRVVETGTHQQLLNKDGYYAKLSQMQP